MSFQQYLICLLPILAFGSPFGASAQTLDAPTIEQIIVTARKRDENLQQTPLSITSITTATINDIKLFDVKDIEGLTPNLNFIVGADGSSSTLQAFIRGVGQFDFAVTTDPGVGVYVDGVYLARSIGANLEFADVERISVLRGPQGTLFGKNTIGGAINVVTRAPSGETRYLAEVTVGEEGYTAFNGYVELPLSENIAVSLSILRKKSDGWQQRTGDDAGNDNVLGLRGHLSWDITHSWNSHLVIDAVDQNQNVYPRILSDFDSSQIFPFLYNAYVLAPAQEACCNTNINAIDSSGVRNDDRDELETLGLSWTNTWDIGDLTLKSITGFRDMQTDILRDSDNQVQKYFEVGSGFDAQQFSQEVLLSNFTGKGFDWLVGAYYFNEDADHTTRVTIAEGLFAALSMLPLTETLPTGTPLRFLAVPFDLTLDYDRTQKTTSYAAFFSTTWHITDKARLNLATRYTSEKKQLNTFTLRRASQTPIALPGPTSVAECSDVVVDGSGSRFTCAKRWSEFSPKLGIDYSFSENLLGYAHVSRGFRSGAFNARPTSTREISIADPEIVTSYEIGFKSTLLERRLLLNGAVFYNDFKDQQLLVNSASSTVATGLILLVDNAAESTLTGAELEFVALPAKGLTISGGIALLHPEFDRFEQIDFATGKTQDLSNRKFRDVPEWSANLLVQYEHSFKNGARLRWRGDMSSRDDIFYTNDEQASTFERLHADGFSTLNAGITYTTPSGNWELSAYGRNLTDEREVVGGFVVDAFGTTDIAFTEPRRFFFSVKYTGGDY